MTSSPFSLTGRRAVVTGASRGIGAAIAVGLARAGADVAGIHLADPEGGAATERAIQAAGRRAIIVEGDTGDPATVQSLADTAVAELGG
ncbi:MAG: short-chain dehydrogenase/reductase, partial [Conexibacter sp.]|nr:short-chain dehydrogenase/reductase [Conexibacter sp.]